MFVCARGEQRPHPRHPRENSGVVIDIHIHTAAAAGAQLRGREREREVSVFWSIITRRESASYFPRRSFIGDSYREKQCAFKRVHTSREFFPIVCMYFFFFVIVRILLLCEVGEGTEREREREGEIDIYVYIYSESRVLQSSSR